MAEERIVTEVAGRVCAIPVEPGAKVGAGEDVVLVEAMKMEIGASSEKGGVVKSILVKLNEMVEEGQAVAIVETA
ncbi:MAG: acetyl-CoA carboxylase biotin carboxyl carrier protein subunit [Methylobacteriaceae bacterium]|nr:acetyl-CoA carboxylase biotin carboxyl carrier protein subunit [Methylobacteriaceae bacterium]